MAKITRTELLCKMLVKMRPENYPGPVEIDGTVDRLQEVLEERTCACGDEITDGSARCADCDMR